MASGDPKNAILNAMTKILKRMPAFKSAKESWQIYETMTEKDVQKACNKAKNDYLSAIEKQWGTVDTFIAEARLKIKPSNIPNTRQLEDPAFEARCEAIKHPSLVLQDFRYLRALLAKELGTLPLESIQLTVPPKPVDGTYDDKTMMDYLTGRRFNPGSKFHTVRNLKVSANKLIPHGISPEKALQVLDNKLADYQKLMARLYYGDLVTFTNKIVERLNTSYLTNLKSWDSVKSYIQTYIVPKYNGSWPTETEFKNSWSSHSNHPQAGSIIEKIYTYFPEKVESVANGGRYRPRVRGTWRRVGESLGLKVSQKSRRNLSKIELENELEAIFQGFGVLSQHFIMKNYPGLVNAILKTYGGFKVMQASLGIDSSHIAKDGTVLDSAAEKVLYERLCEVKEKRSWLDTIQVHRNLEFSSLPLNRFSVDFLINGQLIIEVEMVDSRFTDYKSSIQRAYVKRNRLKRESFASIGQNVIFLQQEDCLQIQRMEKTMALIEKAINKGKFQEAPPDFNSSKHRVGLNYWSNKQVKSTFLEAQRKVLELNPEVLTLEHIFQAGPPGLRDAFYGVNQRFRENIIKGIRSQLNQATQYKDGTMTQYGIDLLKKSLRLSRGILMSDARFDDCCFDTGSKSKIMKTLKRHYGNLKDIAVEFGFGWIANGKSIQFKGRNISIPNGNLKTAIQELHEDPQFEQKLNALEKYLLETDRKALLAVQNAYCYKSGEMFDEVKADLIAAIRRGGFILNHHDVQLAQYIGRTIGASKFKAELKYGESKSPDLWRPPKIWPKLA